MQRRRFGIGGSSALTWTLGFAVVAACSVYDASLLTGGSSGQGGTSNAGEGGEGATSGGDAGSSGNQGGGSGGSGASGGTVATGGSGTGGSKGGGAGTTGGSMGGSDLTGGDGGESGTAGSAGSGAGSGGNGGSAGDGGAAGSGGACGKCGCGMPDTPDTDGDGVLDCVDRCMGVSDADCTALADGLAHRYSFSGTGTVATDSKGTQDGQILNATLTDTGSLTLTGGNTTSPPYVDLPDGIISSLTNATFEAWLTWNQSGTTGRDWQRIFDFGTSGTEDFPPNASPATTGTTYVFVTCRTSTSPNFARAAFTTSGSSGESTVDGGAALATGSEQHVALVIDDQNDEMRLYINGALQNTAMSFTGQLSEISDVNNWLGRSQYSGDYELLASYNEFRIYGVALTAAQLDTSFTAGPNADFLD